MWELIFTGIVGIYFTVGLMSGVYGVRACLKAFTMDIIDIVICFLVFTIFWPWFVFAEDEDGED